MEVGSWSFTGAWPGISCCLPGIEFCWETGTSWPGVSLAKCDIEKMRILTLLKLRFLSCGHDVVDDFQILIEVLYEVGV